MGLTTIGQHNLIKGKIFEICFIKISFINNLKI